MHGPLRLVVVASGIALFASRAAVAAPARDVAALLEFGAEMAAKGNWREAQYRWTLASEAEPDNPRVLNNLAVGAEALGDPGRAHDLYARALSAGARDARIEKNAVRSERFWESARQEQEKDGAGTARLPAPSKESRSKRGEAIEVTVSLPLPPKLDLGAMKSLLVASFLVNETELLDLNREIVRFLRAEFRKNSPLRVLDVTPAPAIPEQTLEDLAANAPFWRQLGREHGADLVVSGALRYTRTDASGFKDVDYVDERTGQKVKQTRFVEQERFQFEVDVLFLSGTTGELLHRDRFRRDALYGGLSNDPITAFYDLSETIAGDVLSVIAQRLRSDVRYVFKG
jgi:hypothetical protein